jgi:hypothetical protein
MSIVALLDYNIVLVCIYSSPHGDLHLFLKNLEIVIKKMHLKRKRVILFGDWNINFMEDSVKLQKLKNLLLLYNLVNTITSPTVITEKSFTL